MDVMQKVQEHYAAAEKLVGADRVWATMLYGSQNYGLDTPQSDVDTKTMVFPTFEDVVLGKKMLSKELQLPDDSLSMVKDYRDMFKNYLKGNINFVETLFTPYYVVNPKYKDAFDKLLLLRDDVANCHPAKLLRMAAGMAKQKYIAMEKPFESKKDVLEKYGYDPKQLHHLARLRFFMMDYLRYFDFKQCLKPVGEVRVKTLRELKEKPLELETARTYATMLMDEVDYLVAEIEKYPVDEEKESKVKDKLDEFAVELFKQFLV